MGTKTYTQTERDIHERHVNLMASCAMCVEEAGDQPDRLTRDYQVTIEVPVLFTVQAYSPSQAKAIGEAAYESLNGALALIADTHRFVNLDVTEATIGVREDEVVVDEIDADTGVLLGTEYRRTR